MPLWLVSFGRKAWAVLKWVIFPIGAVLWFLSRRREVKVTSSEMEGQARVELDATVKAAKKREEARERRDAEVSEVEREIDSKLEDLKKGAEETADRLEDDPEATNEFLKGVGRGVRGE